METMKTRLFSKSTDAKKLIITETFEDVKSTQYDLKQINDVIADLEAKLLHFKDLKAQAESKGITE